MSTDTYVQTRPAPTVTGGLDPDDMQPLSTDVSTQDLASHDRLEGAVEAFEQSRRDIIGAAMTVIATHAPRGAAAVRFKFNHAGVIYDGYLDRDGNELHCHPDRVEATRVAWCHLATNSHLFLTEAKLCDSTVVDLDPWL